MFGRIRGYRIIGLAVVLALHCAPSVLSAQTYDLVFRGGFDDVTDAPANDAEAARFLTQATFGPTRAEIARLRGIGYGQWLEQQFSQPPTLTGPWLDELSENPVFSLNSGHRVDRFYFQAVFAPDQLRQRMAFALSQILVASDDGGISTRETAEYYDILVRRAFGQYRPLLGEVTFSPTMGQWLTYLRNRAAYESNGNTVLPDENYAREVMQLFSFGLVKRNLDFSLQLNAGEPIPTYDNTVISELARLFTGLSYDRTDYTNTRFGNNTNRDPLVPMICFPMNNPPNNQNYMAGGATFHDTAAKTIFDGIVLPGVGNTRSACEGDINVGLNRIADHPSVAPFLSRQLIQRFVTSNPSPDYIERVATVFNNNGNNVRGDLAAVLQAILMDPEARAAPSADFGKLREPVLRMTAAWRALEVIPGAPEPPTNSNGSPNSSVGNLSMTLGFNRDFEQRPMSSPTVFNFYEPDFQAPGPIQTAGLYSPEFQILTETSVTRMNNTIRSRAVDYYQGSNNPPATRPLVNLGPLADMIITPNATTYGQLVDELSLRLMAGQMSASMRATLLNMLTSQSAPTTEANRIDRVRQLLRVTLFSPEFAVQK